MTKYQLTKDEVRALLALKSISEGKDAFLNVIDGDNLVRKGLAELFGKGQFVLTAEGEEALKKL